MNFKKLLFVLFLGIAFSQVQAQEQLSRDCGVGLEEGALIVERLEKNRRNISQNRVEAFRNSRSIKYLPVKFHVVRSSTGAGQVPLTNLMAMLCDMNDDFLSQDIQFYLQGVTNSVNFMDNNTIYNDGASNQSKVLMSREKSSGAINIFISPSINNQVASYYFGYFDYVFVLNRMCNGSSSTGTHEVGHFFSLPHTFYGWEGTNATQYAPGNVPSSVGGYPVERIDRTNCRISGDRICDTESDYISFRDNCPFNGTLKDPTGVQIDPEESYFMSYFADACVDSFSPGQKDVIARDVIDRWNSFDPPAITGSVTGAGVTASTPANNSSVPLNDDITFEWSAANNATAYIFRLERSFLGIPFEDLLDTIVYSNNVTLAKSRFGFPNEYSWSVRPINQYRTCGSNSSDFVFKTTAPVSVSITHETFSENAEFRILKNPITTSTAELLITVPKEMIASLSVYSIEGKELVRLNGIRLNAGDNAQLIEVNTLPNGVYILNVQTELGNLQQKLVIQR